MDGLRVVRMWALLVALLFWAGAAAAEGSVSLENARRVLVEEVAAWVRATGSLTGRPNLRPEILTAMREVPRHEFVPDHVVRYAYEDIPLPAGHGLRESQPLLVALMTDLVAPQADDDLLILGVGGGYHAALASKLVNQVYCLDLNKDAAAAVTHRLRRLGYDNVEIKVTDPYYGWPEPERRFDAIIIRLAVEFVPPTILNQLKPGGRLIAPIGRSDAQQSLSLLIKDADGSVRQTRVMPVRFMRLPGGERI